MCGVTSIPPSTQFRNPNISVSRALRSVIGPNRSPAVFDDFMLDGDYKWLEGTNFYDEVLKVKEDRDRRHKKTEIVRGATHINGTGFKQYLENATSA